MLELYHDPISASSQKVRLVLAELQLDWTDRTVSLLAGEQHSEDYRAVNPRGEVPALVHDGWTLTESAIIAEYLVEAFAPGALVPAQAQQRARMRYWMHRVSNELHEGCGVLSYAIAVRPIQLTQDRDSILATIEQMPDPRKREIRRAVFEQGMDCDAVADALRRHVGILRELDAQLSGDPRIVGTELSLADLIAIPYVVRLENLSMWPFVEKFPNVVRWHAALTERPSFTTAVTDMAPDFIVEASRSAGDAAWPRVRELLAGCGEAV